MSKTPFYKTGLGTYQGQTSDGALLYSSPLFLTPEEKLKLKEKGEKQYEDKKTTTTSKKVEGGTEYTDTTKQDWTAQDKYEGKTFKEAGVSAEEGRKYWEENPEEYQPSGTCNFSRIDNAHIRFTMNGQGDGEKVMSVYAVNYNILIIQGGQAGLAYTH